MKKKSGRPTRKKTVADKMMTVRATAGELRSYKAAARKLGLSMSDFIRRLYAEWKKKQ